MAGSLLRPALRGTLNQIRHVAPVRPGRADARVAGVYADVERDFGMLAPPVALHAPAPAVLAAAWTMLRESLVAAGAADRADKEAVAAAVSAANSCPYCVEVHDTTLRALAPGRAVTPELTAWLAGRGPAPYPAAQLPEVTGVAVTFHYLNRMVSVFLGPSPLPPGAPAAARQTARRVLGRFLRRSALVSPMPGTSLDLLPSAPLPADLGWAAGVPSVAGAFARAARVIGTAGERSVPEPVRELVEGELAAWDGGPRGMSRAWVEEAAGVLPPEHRPAARLALLTAMAAYQVDDATVAAFHRSRADDAALVELTAWASFTAARRLAPAS